MHPILFRLPSFLGGFPIRSFGVMVALGFLAGLYLTQAIAKRRGIKPELIQDLFFWILLGGILGARLMYVAVHPEEFKDITSIVAIWKGGLVFYGGFFGAILLGVWFLRRHHASVLEVADASMPGAFLGLCIGRWGCFLVGDDYGRQTDVAWAVKFPDVDGSLMPKELIGVPVHPTQLYLSLNAFLIFVILFLMLRKRRFPGQILWSSFMLYSIGRFIIEFYRGDNAARGFIGPLSTSQAVGIPLFLLGAVMFVRGWQRSEESRMEAAPEPKVPTKKDRVGTV